MGIGSQFDAFGTLIIGKEREAAIVHPFEQNNPRRRNAIGRRSGQGHCIWLGQLGGHGLVEPRLKLLDGVRMGIRFVEGLAAVVFAEIGDRRVHCSQVRKNLGRIRSAGGKAIIHSRRRLFIYSQLNLYDSQRNPPCSQLNLKGREPFDVMTVLLAGDIGGTKTILRLVGADQGNPLYEMRYSSHQFPHLVPLVETFLAAATEQLGQPYQPEQACFAIAGPVVNETSKLTNLGWQLESACLAQDLAIPKVTLINDFAAVGYGVLGLAATDLETLQPGAPQTQAPIAVLGAGTGLGQGFLIHTEQGYQVFASEGGHADFAPRSELEYQLLRYLLDKHNIGRISVERIVSGQGVVAIYQFLRDRDYAKVSPEVEDVVRQWECQVGRSEKTVDAAAAIALAALEGRDRLSEQALQIFVEAYGAEAGNLALKLLPYGGLYVAGGIAAKIMPLIKTGGFLSAFTNKGRMRQLLEQVPVHIVLNPQVGLIGAALHAARL